MNTLRILVIGFFTVVFFSCVYAYHDPVSAVEVQGMIAKESRRLREQERQQQFEHPSYLPIWQLANQQAWARHFDQQTHQLTHFFPLLLGDTAHLKVWRTEPLRPVSYPWQEMGSRDTLVPDNELAK
ncbi:MAG: hypothetical protein ACFCUI_12550 [Bernardetiaceae bacterium]